MKIKFIYSYTSCFIAHTDPSYQPRSNPYLKYSVMINCFILPEIHVLITMNRYVQEFILPLSLFPVLFLFAHSQVVSLVTLVSVLYMVVNDMC